MSFRASDWPLTTEQLLTLISHGESVLVELKREWWNLERAEGKALLARQVIALANAVGKDELGLIVFGIDDERRGTGIRPVANPPDPEAVTQILSGYVQPPVKLQCRHYQLPEGAVSAIAVLHSAARPHLAIREHTGILSPQNVYVRRDRQVGILTVPELERMIREKDASVGALIGQEPVQFGFISIGQHGGPRIVMRVQNVTAQDVADISLTIDVAMARDPSLLHRSRLLGGASLRPGEVRDVEFNLGSCSFYKVLWAGSPPRREFGDLGHGSHVGDRWLDVTAHLLYRDADGFLRTRKQAVAVDL